MNTPLTYKELKDFLEEKVLLYNNSTFIEADPIKLPRQFTKKEDIEIIGFLVATISWGNRKSILKSGDKLVSIMGNSPSDFIKSYTKNNQKFLSGFVHRTFNEFDLHYFILSLQNIYKNHKGLETVFAENSTSTSTQLAIHEFKKKFFELPHEQRTQKHVSDPNKNSAAKRINMYLRWMVREDTTGVDFGLWKSIQPSALSCPLDVHSGNIARKLGVLERKQNDGKALSLLDHALRKFDANDPVKYDFALFGLGAIEHF